MHIDEQWLVLIGPGGGLMWTIQIIREPITSNEPEQFFRDR